MHLEPQKNILNPKQLVTVYNSMFQPYLDYGIILWGGASNKVLKPIEIQQKKAIRLISNEAYNAHTQPLYKQHRILQIHDLYTLHINRFMFQLHNNNLPISVQNMFISNNKIHDHQTRNINNPHFKYRRTAIAANSI